jgi:hypothetical protein
MDLVIFLCKRVTGVEARGCQAPGLYGKEAVAVNRLDTGTHEGARCTWGKTSGGAWRG